MHVTEYKVPLKQNGTIMKYNTPTAWGLAVIVTARCIGSIAHAQSEVGTITPSPDKLSGSGPISVNIRICHCLTAP
mgnify:CR=1 FL=1